MTPLLLYIARGGLYLGLFYAFFLLVMRKTTFFRLNRILLLAGSYLCLLLPALRLRTANAAAAASGLTVLGVGAEPADAAAPSGFPWLTVVLALYAAGALTTLVLYLVSVEKMARLIRKGRTLEQDGCRLVVLDESVPSFSCGRTVVISREDLEVNPAIFTHELMHVRCLHTLDLLLLLPIQLIFWWNPLVWITREELRLLHEYEADEGVLRNGIDAAHYQLLLVRKAAGEQRFILASEFQHAQLKKRIKMMLRPASPGTLRWSYLTLLPVLAGVMFVCNPAKAAGPEASDEREQSPYTCASIVGYYSMPSFNGGGTDEFTRWVDGQLQELKQRVSAEGSVLVQFTVGADGAVENVQVVGDLRKDLDEAAVRTVSASPKWTPARNSEGEAVPVDCAVSVTF